MSNARLSGQMARFFIGVAVVYAVFCVVALVLIPASANGWFGIQRDPLIGYYAVMLSVPWSVSLSWSWAHHLGAGASLLLVVLGMAINLAIILGLGKLIAAWGARRRD